MKQKLLLPAFAALLLSIISFFPSVNNGTNVKIDPIASFVQTDTVVRGLNYAGFLALTPLDTPQQKFLPSMWSLWEAAQWQPLETLIANNSLNGFYPPAAGFVNMDTMTLTVGTKLDRYGSLWGSFVAPEDAPFPERSLPDSCKNFVYYQFIVTKNISNVMAGKAIPWFGQAGMGMQYKFKTSIKTLIDSQWLKITETVPAKPQIAAKQASKKMLATAKPTMNEVYTIKANGKSIQASVNDFASNPLHTLRHKVAAAKFEKLVVNAGLKKEALNHYFNKNGVPVFYFPYKNAANKKSYWVAVSYGEVSSGHFNIGFEGMVEERN